MNPIRMIIADDHMLLVDGIKVLLKDYSQIEIIDIAHDGKELLDILNKSHPDLILLDINMPNLNGLEALKKISTYHRSIKVIILSTYNEAHLIQKAKEYGANGYILKNTCKEELIDCIEKVMSGLQHFPKTSPQQLINEFDQTDGVIKQYQLTKRESEILQLIKDGFTNQLIAEKLYLSIYTVETHRKNIMQKLGLNSPSTLMKFIVENKM